VWGSGMFQGRGNRIPLPKFPHLAHRHTNSTTRRCNHHLAPPTMRVTDAAHTKVVDIPADLAIVSGIFKDMIESGAQEGSDPVPPSFPTPPQFPNRVVHD
jgi:hypothetical protein